MGRVIIGSAAAAIAMFIIGFIFYATPLSRMHVGSLDNAQAAAVQQALAANAPASGTYHVPSTDTPEQTVMYGQGPISTIHYNTNGYSVADPGAMIGGLLLDFVVALLLGTALIGIDRRVPDFASRARLVVLFAIAASAYMHLGGPIWYHHDWGHFIYRFIVDALTLAAGGLIIARWFLPRAKAAPAGAPTDV
ncbi:MAG TPA: hypothetical protein VNT77_03835 [Allosphingosinicella sp.]|nr:hypothetical protein [Allosphingosinicella sp.]